MQIPSGHQTIMPYLMLKNTNSFLAFTQRVFGANTHIGDHNEDKTIRHAEIQVGSGTIMCSEAREDWPVQNAHLFIYVENADIAYQKALEEGATSKMELSDQPYGRTCGITDPCGNVWWITSL